ncbi:MAG: hypothetical protein NVS2B16_04760 [Chloroflexota bacterium]
MKPTETDSLTFGQLAGIAVIAVAGSTIACVSVYLAVRARRTRKTPYSEQDAGGTTAQPAVGTITPAGVPHHFSEDLVIPGLTLTGQETIQQDNVLGRSPEGV